MKKFFEKNETLCCILLIVAYVVINSYCIQNFSEDNSVNDYRTTIVLTVLSVGIIALMAALNGLEYYGIKKCEDVKKFLYFIPLVIIATSNFWGGINTERTTYEIVFHILSMINVGFLEEVIFRGFLFRMMAKSNEKSAIIVTSLTFGIGHIVNLLNGAAVVPTLLQIGYAVALGYLFVIILIKGKSLIPCIITHMAINSLSVFAVDNVITQYVVPISQMILPACYVIYIHKVFKEEKEVKGDSENGK